MSFPFHTVTSTGFVLSAYATLPEAVESLKYQEGEWTIKNYETGEKFDGNGTRLP